MPDLVIQPLQFHDADLDKWRRRKYGFLERSSASPYLMRLLPEKAKRRTPGTQRFFGEAVVATNVHHVEGWYGSFKWLRRIPKGDKWFHREFRQALGRYIPRLPELHTRFDDITRLLGVGKPVPPDLWLLTRGRRGRMEHHFIDAKMPRDKLAPTQVAGLAVISLCLPLEGVPVSVGVAPLSSPTMMPPATSAEEALFRQFCAQLEVNGFRVRADL